MKTCRITGRESEKRVQSLWLSIWRKSAPKTTIVVRCVVVGGMVYRDVDVAAVGARSVLHHASLIEVRKEDLPKAKICYPDCIYAGIGLLSVVNHIVERKLRSPAQG